jgi:acetolactate synthase-1/3 small subunit
MGQALALVLDRELLALNRAVGELRRRNVAITSVAVGPADAPGCLRLTLILDTDEATAELTMKKMHKVSGVRAATRFPVDEGVARELALVKVRVTPERYAEFLDVCDTFKATVVDEGHDQAIVQLAGPEALVLAFVRALEGFGILEMTRTGTVALPRAAGAERAAAPAS